MFYDLLVEPLTYNFFLQATFVCILIGIVCPLLGAFVINRELGFMGDAMAHSVLPGMIIAYSIGVNAFLGAIPNAIAIALLIGFLVRRFKISTDTSIGIDLLITTKSPPLPKQSLLLANFAEEFDLARVSWCSKLSGLEPIALRRRVKKLCLRQRFATF